ncbi:hypothetical protein OG216_34830 [Streptomycetaceae bacterium NBC_01309]
MRWSAAIGPGVLLGVAVGEMRPSAASIIARLVNVGAGHSGGEGRSRYATARRQPAGVPRSANTRDWAVSRARGASAESPHRSARSASASAV